MIKQKTTMKNCWLSLFAALAVLGLVRSQASCTTDNWGGCAVEVAQKIFTSYKSLNSWHDHQPVNLFGTSCTSAIKGGFYRWQWRWQGTFSCPALSGMEGYASNLKSRTGAIEHALKDYIQKGAQHGFLNAQQLANPF